MRPVLDISVSKAPGISVRDRRQTPRRRSPTGPPGLLEPGAPVRPVRGERLRRPVVHLHELGEGGRPPRRIPQNLLAADGFGEVVESHDDRIPQPGGAGSRVCYSARLSGLWLPVGMLRLFVGYRLLLIALAITVCVGCARRRRNRAEAVTRSGDEPRPVDTGPVTGSGLSPCPASETSPPGRGSCRGASRSPSSAWAPSGRGRRRRRG